MPLTELWTLAGTNGYCSPHKVRSALRGAWKINVGIVVRLQKQSVRRRGANMTFEQRDAEGAHLREYKRKRRANMTPEQRDALRAYHRQYARKRQSKARPP